MRLKAIALSITVLALLGLVAAACGGDDSDARAAPNGGGRMRAEELPPFPPPDKPRAFAGLCFVFSYIAPV